MWAKKRPSLLSFTIDKHSIGIGAHVFTYIFLHNFSLILIYKYLGAIFSLFLIIILFYLHNRCDIYIFLLIKRQIENTKKQRKYRNVYLSKINYILKSSFFFFRFLTKANDNVQIARTRNYLLRISLHVFKNLTNNR